jgi:ferredoxin
MDFNETDCVRLVSEGCNTFLLCNLCMSVCPHETVRLPPGGFFLNLIFKFFFESLSRKFKFLQNAARITDTLHVHSYDISRNSS